MAIKTKIYNAQADVVGEIDLAEAIFGLKPKAALIHQVLVAQQANSRQVLAHTKDRSEVRGGGKKPWRQKGTGRARAGSSRSPIWIGGGVTFGPTNDRNFSKKINKKMKQAALLMALSDRLANQNLAVIENLEVSEYRTKLVDGLLNNITAKVFGAQNPVAVAEKKTKNTKKEPAVKTPRVKRSILIINDQADEKIKYSTRNLVGVKLLYLDNINLVDLLKYKYLILTKGTVDKLEERYK